MARPCAICIHDSRAAIEQAILSRKPASQIARNFGFTYTRRSGPKAGQKTPDHRIVTRHRDEHMGKAYQTAVAESEAQSGVAMVNRLKMLDEAVDFVMEKAREGVVLEVEGVPLLDDDGQPLRKQDLRLMLAAVRESRANIDTGLKLSGRTEHDPQTMERIRAQLQDPEARRLLAELDAHMARAEAAGDKPA